RPRINVDRFQLCCTYAVLRLCMDVITIILIFSTLPLVWFVPATSITTQIRLCQGLSVILALLAIWTAVANANGWIALLAVILIGIAVSIRPLVKYVAGTPPFTTKISLDDTAPPSMWQRVLYFVAGLSLTMLSFTTISTLVGDGSGVN